MPPFLIMVNRLNLNKTQYWLLPLLYFLVILFATNRNYFLPVSQIPGIFCDVTQFNNYIIFKNSFFHLFHDVDLYKSFPNEQYDLFKYTPTFSLLFAFFALLPNYLGLLLWNSLNVILPLIGMNRIFGLSKHKAIFSILFIPEVLTSVLNSQSNGIILGLLLLSFASMQKAQTTKAVFYILLTVFIKLFGGLFFALFLLFPNQIKKAVLVSIPLFLFLFFLPCMLIDLASLFQQYDSYFSLLKNDGQQFMKYSIMGWLNAWFHFCPSKNIVIIIGLLLQLLPIIIVRVWNNQSKILYAMSILIWIVIFNHMAESATYIIAVGAIFVALSTFDKMPQILWVLLIFMFLTTELGPSDIYPKELRIWIVDTAQLKAFPCILFWIAMLGYTFWGNRLKSTKNEF